MGLAGCIIWTGVRYCCVKPVCYQFDLVWVDGVSMLRRPDKKCTREVMDFQLDGNLMTAMGWLNEKCLR